LKILFLTLKTFSATGGIEKVCRVAGRAMYENAMASPNHEFLMYSMHDTPDCNTQPYLPSSVFKGFDAAKVSFITKSVKEGIKKNVVILSHINLLVAGYLIKVFSPKTKLVLIAHGIEVWKPLTSFKKKMLRQMDRIAAVSHFTKEKMKELFDLPEEKFVVLNNCLDPFLPEPSGISRRNEFRNSYGFTYNDIVLMTLTRLSSKEQNKNYDKVFFAIKKMHNEFPNIKYLFVGKYEEEEKNRLEALAQALGIEYDITFTGFVPDSVIGDYYSMADVYIMPSEKEGFGISFIEAMFYKKPVIGGNRDGTTDALANGLLGILVDPRSQEEVIAAIQKVVTDIKAFIPDRQLLLDKFSYTVYKNNWSTLLNSLV
jgi:glycosyltransferase involved in cell wall biosynthesis